VDPGNSRVVFAALRGGGVSSGGVFRSTDGGRTWSPTTVTNSANVVAFDPTNPSTVYAGASGIFKSTDGGNTWSAVNQGLKNADGVLSIVVDPQNPSTVYAGTDGGCFKSTDGGQSWSPTGLGIKLSESAQGLAIDPVNDAVLYAAPNFSATNWVYESTDSGAHWSKADAGAPEVTSVAVNPATPATVYAGTFQASVRFSYDGGQTWQ
jgi:photosystem II stability/assembly factor-like uncharacterized protein